MQSTDIIKGLQTLTGHSPAAIINAVFYKATPALKQHLINKLQRQAGRVNIKKEIVTPFPALYNFIGELDGENLKLFNEYMTAQFSDARPAAAPVVQYRLWVGFDKNLLKDNATGYNDVIDYLVYIGYKSIEVVGFEDSTHTISVTTAAAGYPNIYLKCSK